jgi:hypothetical protein
MFTTVNRRLVTSKAECLPECQRTCVIAFLANVRSRRPARGTGSRLSRFAHGA